MDIRHNSLPEPAARALLDQFLPGSTLCSIRPVAGEFYNRQFYLDASLPQEATLPQDASLPVEARSKEGEDQHFVVKLYQGDFDFCVRRARVEYQALRWLHLHQRPAPEPVFLDDTGELLGGPCLVTRFLPGSPIMNPPYPPDWGRQMARTLADIHAYPCDESAKSFLLDGNRHGFWFRETGSPPGWMAADPDGRLVWDMIEKLLPRQEKITPRLLHTDFWGGNVLCDAGRITAVVDWEEASYGDPGHDVAYGMMNLFLSGSDQDAEEFLSTYSTVTGGPVANLTLWKLAAAARPMLDPHGWWIDRSPWKERFRRFIQETVGEENRLKTS